MTQRTVRFQLDEDDKQQQQTVAVAVHLEQDQHQTSLKRSISGMLRLEDESDTWF